MMPNLEQAKAWNEDDGQHWAAHRERQDLMLRNLTPHLLRAAELSAGERVLDVGCGAGETTCLAAEQASGATGIDLSRVLLDEARSRARDKGLRNVEFVEADAQVHPFEPARFDVAISRFGVMFFDDPEAAFTNIAHAVRPGGRLAFLCWQAPERNEWVAALGAALAAGGVEVPSIGDGGPGPFSLAEPDRIRKILAGTGMVDVTVDPVAAPLRLGSDVADVIGYVQGLGVFRSALAEADPWAADRVLDFLRDGLAKRQEPDGIFLGAAAWLVTAERAT